MLLGISSSLLFVSTAAFLDPRRFEGRKPDEKIDLGVFCAVLNVEES